MPRYVFTEKDLAQFLPLLKKPVVQQVIGAVRPIKDPTQKPQHVEDVGTLPVPIRGRDNPDGLPLEGLQRVVKGEISAVNGLSMRRGRLEIIASRKLDPNERARLKALLGNRERLEDLRRQHAAETEGPSQPGIEMDPHLREMLLDEKTPNEKWLAAFRKFAVARLIPRK